VTQFRQIAIQQLDHIAQIAHAAHAHGFRFNLIRAHPAGIHGGDHRPHAGARKQLRFDAVRFEDL
jgi:hypothetical protein